MINQRIKELRLKKGKSQGQLSEDLGIKRSTLAGYEAGSNEPSIEKLKLFADYFEISIDELVLGPKSKFSRRINNTKVLAISVDNHGIENIELIPHKAKAGYIAGYNDIEFIKNLPKISLPNLPTGTYRAFEIQGDSMPPINDGFIVIGRYVEDWRDIKGKQCYILISKSDGMVFKRIESKIELDETLVLHSDNLAYSQYSISIHEVLEAWLLYAYIGYPGKDGHKVVENLFDKLQNIDNKINKLLKS
jgi:transcriptional regulator with XRE-family HTH domain